jgi:hypothetical protein
MLMDDEEILRNWKEQPAIPYIAVKRMLIEARADEREKNEHMRFKDKCPNCSCETTTTTQTIEQCEKEAFKRGKQQGAKDERERIISAIKAGIFWDSSVAKAICDFGERSKQAGRKEKLVSSPEFELLASAVFKEQEAKLKEKMNEKIATLEQTIRDCHAYMDTPHCTRLEHAKLRETLEKIANHACICMHQTEYSPTEIAKKALEGKP